nr:hypothetical protein [Tanacetum cinerariifolium]
MNKLGGMKLNKTKAFEYRPVAASKAAYKEVNKEAIAKPTTDVPTTNAFSALHDDLVQVEEGETSGFNKEDGNTTSEQRQLWTELGLHIYVVRGHPWILMSDFNVALNLEDSISGSLCLNAAMYDFKACVNKIEVMDINASRLHFTCMGNLEFVDTFPGAYGVFQPYIISDHSHAVLKIPSLTTLKRKPFKFFNFLTFKSEFLAVVKEHWNIKVEGHNMTELDEVQKALDKNPNDSNLHEEEAVYVRAFTEAKLDEERFLKQKAKIEWLEVGDSNSVFFHKSVKSRNQRSRIEVIRVADNVEVIDGLFTNVISTDTRLHMVRMVTNDEIKSAMFNIGEDRAPGSDGFTSAFFKKSWDVVGNDICNAMKDFFINGKLLKEINHTFLALFPKVSTPLKVNDYQPISCCNILYKCISKVLTNRIIEGIKEVASENQSAFILDDMFIFARGELDSARLIMESIDEFQKLSDLVPSIPKSTTYFCNVLNQVKLCILNIMLLAEGELPALVLVIPKGILLDIQQHMHGFLWCNRELKRGKAKEGWSWPQAWLLKALNLTLIPVPILEESWHDTPQWKDANGKFSNFLVKCAWDALRTREPMAHRRTAKSIIRRLLVAAASYFIWVESNNRMFKNGNPLPKKVKENEPLNKEIVNIKESKDHPIEIVIGNQNERTLRSQVQNQNNFFCFVSSIEPKNIKEAIKDEI